MHGSSVGTPVPLTTWGGLVTLASADSMPEGASPRCYDNDYLVGSTRTRDGLTSIYTYSGAAAGPNHGGFAENVPITGTAWANPSFVLADDGNYATVTLNAAHGVDTVTVNDGGRYTSSTPPSVVFTGSGSGASAIAVMSLLVPGLWFVSNVIVTAPGSYIGTPSISFTGTPALFPAFATANMFPAAGSSDAISINTFGFAVPSTSQVQGIEVTVKESSTFPYTLYVQMVKAGVPVGDLATGVTVGGSVIFGGANSLFGSTWNNADLNNVAFGVRLTASATSTATVSVGYVTIKVFLLPGQANFNFITTFVDQNGVVKNISLDAAGNLWVENVSTNPGVIALATENIAPNSYGVGVQGEGVEYLAFNDGKQGIDVPRQYTADWIDRITQVGPGASPIFTATTATTDVFNIATITQPAQKSDPADSGHFQALLWSQGPGSATAGNVITVYYAEHVEDTDLTTAFNSGNPVFVYISTAPFGNGTYLVTSVGKAVPPHGSGVRYYFTYQIETSGYQFLGGPDDATGFYQRTLATMTMTDPVPGLQVGNQVTITGASVAAYNAVWTISQAVNSAVMAITSTSVAAGVATYNYTVVSGAAPFVGQTVTITGTTNADGALNLVNATIATVVGTGTGHFTINISIPDAASSIESGQGVTAGTIFCFDPGLTTLGTTSSPIYGSSTGGSFTFGGAAGQFIGPGTRQGVVFFITRNGYYTAPSPPITFTCPDNTTAINASLIPIGPPNVIARGIAFTEAGQLGTPGANFFNIPEPVDYIVQNVKYTADALIIKDNTTTSKSFFFTDFVLLNARAIDIYGFNLFNQIELGNPGWITNYDSRNFYGLCQNKIQNFLNLSFDGGFLPSNPVPLGWTTPDTYGSLLPSPVFGNSYYIHNTTAGTLAVAGLISQPAYQDAYKVAIINPNTAYSVRVTARIPSGNTVGNLQVDLFDSGAGVTYGVSAIAFGSLESAMKTITLTMMPAKDTIPIGLLLRVYAAAIGPGADVEIDRIDVFPTDIPVLGTTVFSSYSGLPEQVDGVTGMTKFISENQHPVNGAAVMYDTFYALKGQGPNSSMYSLVAQDNLEPANWNEPEVSQRVGSCGPMAFDFGEQWLVMACRNGIYLYEGGQPGKINQEIYQIWDAINWEAGDKIWVKVDVVARRLFVGIPLPTPNFWLPNAPVNLNPTTPNVILMLNWQGLDTGQEIKKMAGLHTTMFGQLNTIDMLRKWSLWQIPSPYGEIVTTSTDKGFYICNGRENSKVYLLDPESETDDGLLIDSLYTTYGFIQVSKAEQMPMLGFFRKRWGYMTMTVQGVGQLTVRFLANQLIGPADHPSGYNPWTVPGGFTLTEVCVNDREASCNFVATRTFLELSGNDFQISALTLYGKKDTWTQLLGRK